MNPHLNEDALGFGEVADRAFASAGGADLARRAEAEPEVRQAEIVPLLDRLGVFDLDARSDSATAEAAAALCRAAGRVALPYPVVPMVLGNLALGAEQGAEVMVNHADLIADWRLAFIDGSGCTGAATGTRLGTRLGPFVSPVATRGPMPVTHQEIGLHLTLTGFVIAGGLTTALELATAHVSDRVQFGKPLSSFQAVQFQLADAHVAVASVDELVQFALWRCLTVPEAALPDALAARLGALDAARTVLRTTQQLHGAAGVCDEYDISVMVRHLQPALRLPFGAESTAGHLVGAVAEHGFDGLFNHGGVPR